MNTKTLLAILLIQVGLMSSIFAQEGKMELMKLTADNLVTSCINQSELDGNVECYGLLYTPKISGVLTSYVTGFLMNCSSSDNLIVSNGSCVMNDKSVVNEDCANSGIVMINCSGNSGSFADNKVIEGESTIIHHVCFNIPDGEVIKIEEEKITDLTTNIDAYNGASYQNSVTDFPAFSEIEIGLFITDVNEEIIADREQLDIYPNPARDEIELITDTKAGEVHLRILDTKGQTAYEKTYKAGTWLEKQKIDINRFADGLYLIEVSDNELKETGRFIKVK